MSTLYYVLELVIKFHVKTSLINRTTITQTCLHVRETWESGSLAGPPAAANSVTGPLEGGDHDGGAERR